MPPRAASRVGNVVGRYYDPTTGQFLTVDPLIDETGAPYSYAGGDPVDNTDPSGQSIPLDFGAYGLGTYNGGSNGAHPGCPVWGNGQLNGYGSLSDAVYENAPGLTRVYGDLSGPTGWSYWGPLLGTVALGGTLAIAPEIVGALSETSAAQAGLDLGRTQASLVRSQFRTVAKLVQDSIVGSPVVRKDALEELRRRAQIANGAVQSTLHQPGSPASIGARAVARWLYTFVRGY